MIKRSADGTLPVFNRFGKVGEFVSVIANAMQNWNDNTQITLPGYRDRMVTVYLGKDEGGLNLDMPATTLERLRLRGAAAGKLISDRFEKASVLDPTLRELGWETHRWLRFRNSMGLIRSYLQLFQRSMRSPELPDVTYGKLCEADARIPVHSYSIAAAERQNISDLASELVDLGSQLEAKAEIAARLPRPLPHLVVRASLKA